MVKSYLLEWQTKPLRRFLKTNVIAHSMFEKIGHTKVNGDEHDLSLSTLVDDLLCFHGKMFENVVRDTFLVGHRYGYYQ